MLTFGAPLFLWGLAALAAPIIVHLINRERAVLQRFPSTRFIEPSKLPQQGRRRLRDFLLLMLRLLVYAAVILALANPRWVSPGSEAPVLADSPVTVFVVDASASMGQRGMDQRLRDAMEQYLDGLPSDSAIGLVVYDDQVIVSQPPTLDRGAALKSLSDAPLELDRAGKPSVGLAAAAGMLDGRPGKVVVFSDFQASDWQKASAARFPVGTELELVSLRNEPERNVGIQTVRVFPASDGSLRIYARVKNDWSEPVPVTLNLDGFAVEATVDLAPNSTDLVVLSVPAEAAPANGQAALLKLTVDSEESWPEENLYLGDDQFHFWLGGEVGFVVGAMIPAEDEPQKMMEASFVGRALEVGDESAAKRFDFVAVDGRNPNWLSQVDALYLPGTGAYFDGDAWAQIKLFVEGGGVLLVTPSKASPRMFRGMREAGISETAYTGKPRRARDRSTVYRVGDLPAGGALAQVFDEDAREDLYLADIYEYWSVKPGPSSEILLETETGDPLILRERLGKGAVIISLLDLDTAASDIPLRNSFVPLLWEMLGESVSEEDEAVSLAIGDALPLQYLGESVAENPTEAPGVIDVGGEPIAINISREESVPQGAVLSDVRGRVLAGNGRTLSPGAEPETESGVPLWPWLGALGLLACAFESLVAARSSIPTKGAA
ncbi:MAG: BatA domain-containing protein [Verrucomicrobiota bacterium]